MKKSKFAAMLAAVTLSMAGAGLVPASAAQASSAEVSQTGSGTSAASEAPAVKEVLQGNRALIYQGDDWAYFNFKTKKVKVCDKEKDGHAVYAYLRHRNGLDADVLYDNTKGCTTHTISSKKAYMYITVCESVWGPDWCRQPRVDLR
ncbi:hypothetical protein ACH4SP_04420 [Streptomyces sp. NPDC021093]|uniref:hypothetical protein n=1 Tax=Streptomyces sp. NPDC021093 TaxID=3365112 RepID=UPI0037A1AC21